MNTWSVSRWWTLFGLVSILFCTETAAASLGGSPLPLGVEWFVGSLGVLGGLVLAGAWLESRRWLSPAGWNRLWYVLAFPVLLVKFGQAGVLADVWPWVLLAGLFVGYAVVRRTRRETGTSAGEGAAVFLLAAAVSPDLAGIPGPLGSTLSVSWMLLPVVFLCPVALVVLLREGLSRGGEFLRRHRVGGLLLLVVLLAGTGLLWVQREDRTRKASFEGRLPTVRIEGDRSVDDLPGILLISIDTLRWDYVPPHAPGDLRLPHLRRLRRDSVVYPRHFSTSSLTYPAHASLFSGLLPVRNGAVGYARILPEVPHYTQLLKKLGYRTLAYTGGVGISKELGFARGFDRYWEYPGRYDELVPGGLQLLEMAMYAAGRPLLLRWRPRGRTGHGLRFFRETVRRGLEGLDGLQRGTSPFFLFLHTYEVHDYFKVYPHALERLRREHPELLRAPRIEALLQQDFKDALADFRAHFSEIHRRLERSKSTRYADDYRALSPRQKQFFDRLLRSGGALEGLDELELEPTEHRRARRRMKGYLLQLLHVYEALYGYGVESMDRALGELLRELRKRGLYRDSLIVFTSDHGEGFLVDSPSLFHGPGDLSEVLIRTPLWIKLPGNRRAGSRVESLAQITDILPSIFRHLGLRPARPPVEASVPPAVSLLDPDTGGERRLVRGSVMAENLKVSAPNLYVGDGRFRYVRSRDPLRRGWSRVPRRGIVQEAVDTAAVPAPIRRRFRREIRQMETILERTRRRRPGRRNGMSTTLWKDLKGMGYF